MTLDNCRPKQSYVIDHVTGTDKDRRHLYNLGFSEGTTIHCLFTAPSGDPVAFAVQGAVIALRRQQVKQITCHREGM